MRALFFIPFLLQVLAMTVDEFYFHRRRDLPLWERIGHPLDTITQLLCFACVLLVSYSPKTLPIYIILAILSSIFVTKDEFVHHKLCQAGEHWLHSLLFILHPTVLACACLLWPEVSSRGIVFQFFIIQFVMMIAFCLYQILYWNFLWNSKNLK